MKGGIGTADVAYIKTGDVAGPSASVALDKSANLREVRPGGTILYTIMVSNTSAETYRNLTVTDTFDAAKVTITNASQGNLTAGTIKWTIPELAAGGRWVVRYSARAAATLPNGTVIPNTSVVDGEQIQTVPLRSRSDSVQVVVVTELPKTGIPGGPEEWFDPADLQNGPKIEFDRGSNGPFGLGFLSTMLVAGFFVTNRRKLLLEATFATLGRLALAAG